MTDDALAASEVRLRAVLDSVADMVVTIGEDGRIESFNAIATRALGYRADEVIGRDVAMLAATPEDGLRDDDWRRYAATGERRIVGVNGREIEARRKDGSTFPVELTVVEARIGDRRTFVGTMRDISDRKRAERALETARANLENALGSTNHAFVLFDADERLVLWNHRFVADYPGLEAFIRPGLTFEEILRESIRRGALTVPEGHTAEDFVRDRMAQFRRADGSPQLRRLNDGRWLQVSTLRSRDGGIIGVGVDVTELMRREEALRESETRLAETQRLAHLGGWQLDLRTQELRWSDEHFRILGLDPQRDAASPQRFMERVHPEDRQRVGAAMGRWIVEGSGSVECRILRPSGEERIVSSQGVVISGPAGEPIRIAGTMQDVTERVRAERAVRESEERLRLIAANIPGVVYQRRLDPEKGLIVTYVSDGARQLSGYEPEEYIREPSLFLRMIHPDDLPDVLGVVQQAECANDGSVQNAEFRVINRDGSVRWARAVSRPRRQADGARVWEGVLIDVTEAKAAEDALRRSEAILANAQRIAGIGSWELDFATQDLSWSDEHYRILGYEPGSEPPSPQRFLKRVHPEDRGRVVATMAAWNEVGGGEVEFRIVLSSGEIRTVRSQGEVERDDAGRPLRMSGVLHDITERKLAEEALRRNEQQLRTVTDAVPVLLSFIDRDQRYRYVNERYEEWFARPRAAIIGKTALEILGAQAYAPLQPHLEAALHGRRSEFESRTVFPDGRTRDVLVNYVPHVDKNGGVTGVFTLVQDISERKQADEALRASQELFAKVFRLSPDVIILTEIETGRYVAASDNFAEIHGYSPAEIIGRTSLELGIWDDPADRLRMADMLKQGKSVRDFETRVRHRSGEVRDISISSELIQLKGETLALIIARDVSQRKKAERALRDSEEKFRSLAEATPFGVCVARLGDGRYVYANAAAALTLGLSVDELLTRAIVDFYDAPDRVAISRQLAKGEAPLVETELKVMRSDGRPVWLAVSAVPTTYADEPAVVIGFYDITARRAAEEALRRSEASLANAQRIAHIGSFARDLRTGEIQWSDEHYRIFGLEPGSKPITLEMLAGSFHPDDRARVLESVRAAVRGERPHDLHHRIVRPNGNVRVVHVQGEIERDEAGRAIRLTGTVQDVTERVRAEQALRESEAQLRLIADSLPIIITYIDRDLRYRFVNRTTCQWYARPAADFLGRSTEELLTAAMLEKFLPYMQEALRGHPVRFEQTLDYPDGQRRRVEIQYVPHILADGAVAGFFTVVADITERTAIEGQLRQAQKMEAVGQLTGGIAHDFNNLLAAVIGNLDLLGERLEGQPSLRELARRAVESAERGAALTQRLLAFSRRQALQPKPVDAGELIIGMDMLLRRTLGDRIRIVTLPSAGMWPCLADPGQLESAILNLAINARDAMPDGGTLTIGIAQEVLDAAYVRDHPEARPGEYVRLSVSDTGTGMTAEVLKRAFEPFFTTKQVGKGSGLGLSMVHGFVRQSGGHVRIESEIGHGTVVHLYLPRAAQPAGPADADRPDDAAPRGRGERILAVEDDPNVREFVADALKGLGYHAVVTGDAASALAALKRSRRIGLLFTDLALPGGRSGIDLVRDARRLRPDLPVLYTSANADAWRRPGGLGPNDEVLAKPYRRADLARALQRKLNQSPET